MVSLKRNGKLTFFWKAFLAVGSVIGVLGAAWGLDKHWLPREIYSVEVAMQKKTMQQIQQSSELSNALNWLQYWQREERDARKIYQSQPSNLGLKVDYEEAKKNRLDAEKRLKKVMDEMK
jgi:hypothetical protein